MSRQEQKGLGSQLGFEKRGKKYIGNRTPGFLNMLDGQCQRTMCPSSAKMFLDGELTLLQANEFDAEQLSKGMSKRPSVSTVQVLQYKVGTGQSRTRRPPLPLAPSWR